MQRHPRPRRRGAAPTLALLLAACSSAAPAPERAVPASSTAELRALHRALRVPGLDSRTFDPAEFWDAVDPIVAGSNALSVEQIGESAEGRPLRVVKFGDGPVPVLLWSQMHGDEPTATMALADLFSLVARRPDAPTVRAITSGLTVWVVPILNPDGAARFQRRNAVGVDVNRDARMLATPEGRALKSIRDRVQPAFAFNLHDQNVGTRVGDGDEGVAIALLAPAFDEARTLDDRRRRAMQVAGVIRRAIDPMVGGHVARYDDTFNPRAFGDLITQWGASTILVESGGWKDDPEKQYLREVNFVGLVAALRSIADGSYDGVSLDAYSSLPWNGRQIADLLVTGGRVAVPGLDPVRADLLIAYDDALRRTGARVTDVGDLADAEARDTVSVDGLFIVPRAAPGDGLKVDAPADFVVSRDAAGTEVVWRFERKAPDGR